MNNSPSYLDFNLHSLTITTTTNLLKQSGTDIVVEAQGKMVPESAEAVQELAGFLRVVDGVGEEVDEPVEGELIHGVEGGQVPQGKEEDGGSDGHGAVAQAGRVDLTRTTYFNFLSKIRFFSSCCTRIFLQLRPQR